MDRSLFLSRLREATQAGHLTPAHHLVALELLRFASRAGTCWPSLETLAEGVGCCVRTVSRALAALRSVGLLSWRRRKVRWNRCASNVYALLVPVLIQNKLIRSRATVSIGSGLAAALVRLGATLGVESGAVMPWLGVGGSQTVL